MHQVRQAMLLSSGWAEPILWGLCQGCTIAEIAEGLELAEWDVVTALECHAPAWYGRKVRAGWLADNWHKMPKAESWAMLNWLKSTTEARRLLRQMELRG